MANSFKLFTKFMTINTICKSLNIINLHGSNPRLTNKLNKNKIRTLTPSILLHILVNLFFFFFFLSYTQNRWKGVTLAKLNRAPSKPNNLRGKSAITNIIRLITKTRS